MAAHRDAVWTAKVLGGKTSGAILGVFLARFPRSVSPTEIAAETGLSLQVIGYHLRKLRTMDPPAIRRETMRPSGGSVRSFYVLVRGVDSILRRNGIHHPPDSQETP